MKKIGILTFHNVPNYGASLQAFALKTYLEGITENEVNLIDYQCTGNNDSFSPERIYEAILREPNPLKKIIKKILFLVFTKKRYTIKYQKFSAFKKNNLAVAKVDELSNCDAVFYGSDQIWNPEITNGFDETYFSYHENAKNAINIAYAASCGDLNLVKDESNEFLSLVRHFNAVSVREEDLCNFITQNGIECKKAIDPVFLLDKQEYADHFKLVSSNEKYLFVYELQKNKTIDEVAHRIAKQKHLKIIKVCGYNGYTFNSATHIYDAGPIDFLNMILGASYVLTNSFHGTAFSIIFHKNFNIILPKLRKGRITSLLNSLDLSDRIYDPLASMRTDTIEYKKVDESLNKQIDMSQKFIKNALNGEKNGKI